MAFGKHWEWRGFGPLSPELLGSIAALPLIFPRPQHLTDEYLWLPSTPINVKLRMRSLKLKRLLRSENGLEEWLEDSDENYPFPLSPIAIQQLCTELRVRLPSLPKEPVAWDKFPELLRVMEPSPRIIAVEKKRWQRKYEEERFGEAVTVEVAEIFSPERIVSVGLEHPSADRVARVRDALGLPGPLRRLSYLEALGIWASGNRLAAGG